MDRKEWITLCVRSANNAKYCTCNTYFNDLWGMFSTLHPRMSYVYYSDVGVQSLWRLCVETDNLYIFHFFFGRPFRSNEYECNTPRILLNFLLAYEYRLIYLSRTYRVTCSCQVSRKSVTFFQIIMEKDTQTCMYTYMYKKVKSDVSSWNKENRWGRPSKIFYAYSTHCLRILLFYWSTRWKE
jgi:hypothetical protein